MKDIALVVTMRTGSSRMPGKMTKVIANNMCSVDFFGKVFKSVSDIVCPIIAVPEHEIEENTELVRRIKSLGIRLYGGSEDDVFKRVLGAAGKKKYVLDITGDCPFISTYLIREFVSRYSEFVKAGENFYASNVFPTRLVPDGQDIQLYKRSLMNEVGDDYIPEHSGYSVYRWCMKNSETSKRETILKLSSRASYVQGAEKIRMTLDTVQDIETLRKLYKFYNLFDCLGNRDAYEGFLKFLVDTKKNWWPNRNITPKEIQK